MSTKKPDRSQGRAPRKRSVDASTIREAYDVIEGHLAAMHALLVRIGDDEVSMEGFNKYEKAAEFLKQFNAHLQFALARR